MRIISMERSQPVSWLGIMSGHRICLDFVKPFLNISMFQLLQPHELKIITVKLTVMLL